MRRTIEKLAEERRAKQDELTQQLDQLKAQSALLDPPALAAALASLFELQNAVVDAKDREWDALSSNHVGMIFKSMEWRVDRLAAASEDAAGLVKTFALLKDQLERLLAILEERKLPTPALVRAHLEPIDAAFYTAFDDACTHGGGSLAAGTLICGIVQCPGHGSQFDTRTGTVRAGPAGAETAQAFAGGQAAFAIYRLERVIPAHKPDLTTDYKQLERLTAQYLQQKEYDSVLADLRKQVYWEIYQ